MSSGALATAMPMLTVVNTSLPSTSTGALSTWWMRSASTIGSRGSVKSSMSTTNSSPPRRATVSVGRRAERQPLGRLATSSWSPAMWPNESLTTLNRSRSRKSRADGLGHPLAPGQDARQLVEQQRPVGQAGERIVQRLVGQLGLGALERGDVGVHHQDVLDRRRPRRTRAPPGTGTTATRPSGIGTSHSVSSRSPLLNTRSSALRHWLSSATPKMLAVWPSDPVDRGAGELLEGRAQVDEPMVAVEAGDHGRRALDHRAVALLAGPQLELLAVALGDVLGVGHRVAQLAVAAPHARDVQPQPQHHVVGAHHPHLEGLLLGLAQHHAAVRHGSGRPRRRGG